MGLIEKTVFLSYRRTDVPWALSISQQLIAHGYDVFFDLDSIASGDFEQVILENIRKRAHFLVLLTPTALDRCSELGDWLRREIEEALDKRRNIVPIALPGFDFVSPAIERQLTGKIALLRRYNALPVSREFFNAAIDRLCEKYLNVPLDEVQHPDMGAASAAHSCSFEVGFFKEGSSNAAPALGCGAMLLAIMVGVVAPIFHQDWQTLAFLLFMGGFFWSWASGMFLGLFGRKTVHPIQVDDLGIIQSNVELRWPKIVSVTEDKFHKTLVLSEKLSKISVPADSNNVDKLVVEIRHRLKPEVYLEAERLMRRIEDTRPNSSTAAASPASNPE